MSDEQIPNGPFTQADPMRRSCGSRENHSEHTDREVQQMHSGKRYMWYACPGWETTHTVTVTSADGSIVGHQNVDLRELTNPDRYLGPNTPELVMIYEARQEGRELTAEEIAFGAAVYYVAPEVCPHDCDRCHEHLYSLQTELEDGGDA